MAKNFEQLHKDSVYRKINNHIDFEREGKKSSARKRATKIICCKCKKEFTLSFKPRRPEVYCDDCFKKKNKKR